MSQKQLFQRSQQRIFDQNQVILDLLFGPNPLTDAELEALINRRPDLERFRGYIGKRGR